MLNWQMRPRLLKVFRKNWPKAARPSPDWKRAPAGRFAATANSEDCSRRCQQWPDPDLSPDANQLFEEFQRLESKTREDLDRFRKILLPQMFRFLPVSLVVLLLLVAVAAVPVLQHFGRNVVSWPETGPAAFGLLVILVFYFQGRRVAAPAATVIAGQLGKGAAVA